ncbi:MAG: aminotransferase class V-fold PLP-dependent enzyme, partial [Erysipelotrichaceae bacterium]|nr:aminotransferase class V-fold PLP-dependent enzyme [Erysipelotrichaceae bacterium]
TVNFAANTVFGKTLRMALDVMDEHYETVRQYHDYLYEEISGIEDVVMNSPQDSSPYIVNFSHLGISSEVMMNALSSRGYLVSARSTCDSNASYSHVISAMFNEENRLRGTIRVSIDASLSWQQIRGFVSALKEISEKYGKATV